MILNSMIGERKMSGKKGRSGRLPRAIELARARGNDDALSCVRRRLPQILEVIVQKAEAGDKECAVYSVDRVLGRPRLEVDQRVKAEIGTLSASDYLQALRETEKIEAEWMGYPSVEAMRQARLADHIDRLEARLLESPERQLTSPMKEISHDPVSEVDITAPFERDVAEEKKGDMEEDGSGI
jgi:hypothetical protein